MNGYNRLIDVTFSSIDNTQEFSIKTPRSGVKPLISISGNLMPQDIGSDFKIVFTNLYTDKILAESNVITVNAGYEGNMVMGITGTITACYTASPGPDKQTVITCNMVQLDGWLNTLINIRLPYGAWFATAMKKISAALGFDTPFIDRGLATATIPGKFVCNSTAREAIAELKTFMPEVNILLEGKRLVATKKTNAAIRKLHYLPVLTQAPQFSGAEVTLVAPWNPAVKPGDHVSFSNKYYTIQNASSDLVRKQMQVTSVQFSFATKGDANEMTLTGMTV